MYSTKKILLLIMCFKCAMMFANTENVENIEPIPEPQENISEKTTKEPENIESKENIVSENIKENTQANPETVQEETSDENKENVDYKTGSICTYCKYCKVGRNKIRI